MCVCWARIKEFEKDLIIKSTIGKVLCYLSKQLLESIWERFYLSKQLLEKYMRKILIIKTTIGKV